MLVRMCRNWYLHAWLEGKEHGAANGKYFDGSFKTEMWNYHVTQQLRLRVHKPREMTTYGHTKPITHMFIAALSITPLKSKTT